MGLDSGGVGDGVIEFMPKGIKLLPVVIVGGKNFNMRPDGSVTAGKRALVELFRISRVTIAKDAPGADELKREFGAFIFSGNGMEADRGHHDDLVMGGCWRCSPAPRH